MPVGCPTGISAVTDGAADRSGDCAVAGIGDPERAFAGRDRSGPLPSGIVSVTAPAPVGTIRCTVLSIPSATQMAPSATTSPAGSLPTSTRPITRFFLVSTRRTAASGLLVTQSDPAPRTAARRVAWWRPVVSDEGSGTESATDPRSASTRTARPTPASAIHAESPPTATASTSTSGTIVAMTRRLRMSICISVRSPTLETQIERSSAVTSSGRTPTGTSATTRSLSGSITATELGSTATSGLDRLSATATVAATTASAAPAAISTRPRRRLACAGSRPRARGGSSAGSCSRTACSSSRSSRPGSSPSSSRSARRASR